METYIDGDGYDRSPDDIEQQILADELLIGRLRARQMVNIQLADEMQLAGADGCRTLTEWVASRTDTSRNTARTLVMTARRLVDRPADHMKLASGERSFERASAASRLNDSVDPDSYDIDSLRRIARRQTGITASDESARFDERYLHIQPTLDDTAWKLWGQLAALDGAIVEQALFARADELPNDFTTARSTKTADALVAICQDSLDPIPNRTGQHVPASGTTEGDSETAAFPTLEALGRIYERTRPGITVFVNAQQPGATVGTLMSGQLIGPNTLEEILCSGTIEAISVTDDGKPLNAGRRTAKIPSRLRKFVIGRDGGCCAEGCTSRYRLQAHHRVHWADGGETDADNLVTLCWFHHHVVIHQRGFTITAGFPTASASIQTTPTERSVGPGGHTVHSSSTAFNIRHICLVPPRSYRKPPNAAPYRYPRGMRRATSIIIVLLLAVSACKYSADSGRHDPTHGRDHHRSDHHRRPHDNNIHFDDHDDTHQSSSPGP